MTGQLCRALYADEVAPRLVLWVPQLFAQLTERSDFRPREVQVVHPEVSRWRCRLTSFLVVEWANERVEERIVNVIDVINELRVKAKRVIIGVWKQVQLQIHGKRTSRTGNLDGLVTFNFTSFADRCVLLFTQN